MKTLNALISAVLSLVTFVFVAVETCISILFALFALVFLAGVTGVGVVIFLAFVSIFL